MTATVERTIPHLITKYLLSSLVFNMLTEVIKLCCLSTTAMLCSATAKHHLFYNWH